jgi:hypothetical protein
MTISQPPQKVRLTKTYEGVITCPQCQKRQKKALASFLGVATQLRVQCGCGARFRILLELRNYYRKRTQLTGTYIQLASQLSGQIMIVNLSFTGLSFTTTVPHPLQVGDLIELHFRLDDPQQSVLCKKAVVKHVHGTTVGAAFDQLNAYEKAIGFYLMEPEEEHKV